MTGPKIKAETALSKRDVVGLMDVELLDRYACLTGVFVSAEREKLRVEILRRMGQDWRSRQRSEAGRMGGLVTAARREL